MPDTCPDCDGPLVKRGTYCRECGWDADLKEDYLDGIELPEDFDYEGALERAGLGDKGWQLLLVAIVLVAALLVTAALL